MNERWLIARGNVFAPSWDTLIALVDKLRAEKWLVGKGTAFTTVERGEKNEEPVPETIDRAFIDDEAREELRMVWTASSERSPLDTKAAKIEIHRAPDFVYPTRKSIGVLPTVCRCTEDLSFEWDLDELTPAFLASTGIYTECEECSRTFDPAKGSAKLVDPLTNKAEDVPGGAAYRFAIKAESEEGAPFTSELVAFLEKEFGRSFYQVGAIGTRAAKP